MKGQTAEQHSTLDLVKVESLEHCCLVDCQMVLSVTSHVREVSNALAAIDYNGFSKYESITLYAFRPNDVKTWAPKTFKNCRGKSRAPKHQTSDTITVRSYASAILVRHFLNGRTKNRIA